jgi:hypothetical protein
MGSRGGGAALGDAEDDDGYSNGSIYWEIESENLSISQYGTRGSVNHHRTECGTGLGAPKHHRTECGMGPGAPTTGMLARSGGPL